MRRTATTCWCTTTASSWTSFTPFTSSSTKRSPSTLARKSYYIKENIQLRFIFRKVELFFPIKYSPKKIVTKNFIIFAGKRTTRIRSQQRFEILSWTSSESTSTLFTITSKFVSFFGAKLDRALN